MVAGTKIENPTTRNSKRSYRTLALVFFLMIGACLHTTFGASLSGTLAWKDADGKPVSFASLEALEDFLLTAEVVKVGKTPEGTTAPQKVLLEKDGIRIYACFRHVKVNQREIRLGSGAVKFNFRDDAIFEVAAYRFARLMGYPNVPPTVVRSIRGKEGTLQAWVADCMTEGARVKEKRQAKNVWRWAMTVQAMQLFDELIYNEDRNLGNVLIDPEWEIWMIDHTRAFRVYDRPANLDKVKCVEKGVWLRLQTVPDDVITDALDEYLDPAQIRTLLQRRAVIVEYLNGLIEAQGESRVLYKIWSDPQEAETLTLANQD